MRARSAFLALLFGVGACFNAHAVYNASATGTVSIIQQMGTALSYTPETLVFKLSSQPTVTGCGSPYFVISPAVMNDATTRKNVLALLMQAKATDASVVVGYDSAGGFCDQGFIGVYWVELL